MKKLLLMMLVTTVTLTSCKKDEPTTNALIRDVVVVPPLTEQFSEGSSITIKGLGFTQTDEIVFRTQTKVSADVVAVITEVGTTQITFIVPSGLTTGETPIVIKRGGIEQILCSVYIAETPDAKLYGFSWGHPGYRQCTSYQIDLKTGVLTAIKTLADYQNMYSPVAIGHVAYGISGGADDSNRIVSFDFDTKIYKEVVKVVARIESLGIIDGTPHIITSNKGVLSLSQVNTQTGDLTLITDFGKLENSEDFYSQNDYPFTYDAKNRTILGLGYWSSNGNQPITLNIDKKSSSLLPRFPEADKMWCGFFAKGDQMCVATRRTLNYSEEYSIYTLNTKYELDKKIATTTVVCLDWKYDAKTDIMYSISFGNGSSGDLYSFDFKTSAFKLMQEHVDVQDLVLVR